MIEKYEGWMLAKSTIHHGGNEKTGSSPILRTIYMYVDGIGEVQMPYVNGNAIRGKLRRIVMKDFFDVLGINCEELSPKLYHVFFSGGALESNEGTTGIINLELRRKIRNLVPVLSLFGCAIGNQMIQGKLKVGHAFPVCKEYKDFLPDFLKDDPRCLKSVRSFCDESFQTRRDDLKADREEDEQAVQMKVDYECFIPGTKFYHWFAIEYVNELEKSVFGHMIDLFKRAPYIGAMAAVGNGEVIFEYRQTIPTSGIYLDYIKQNINSITDVIREISEVV
ncbi:MAG: hypothetical protein N2517_09300 [Ignavibacteria bacterium]|nr:hypothetical protein [Ignavibacteria bacterium]